jgi:hypothetical protein
MTDQQVYISRASLDRRQREGARAGVDRLDFMRKAPPDGAGLSRYSNGSGAAVMGGVGRTAPVPWRDFLGLVPVLYWGGIWRRTRSR